MILEQLDPKKYRTSEEEAKRVNAKIRVFNQASQHAMNNPLPAASKNLLNKYQNFKGNCESEAFYNLQSRVIRDAYIRIYQKYKDRWKELSDYIYNLKENDRPALDLKADALVAIKEYATPALALRGLLIKSTPIPDIYEWIRRGNAARRRAAATRETQNAPQRGRASGQRR